MKRPVFAALLALLPAAALADTVGTYLASGDGESQQLTISYKDERNIRMEVGKGSYVLITGDKAYTVHVQGSETTVVDLDTLPKLGALPPGHPPKTGSKPAREPKITKTGRTETIAGIKGDVYEVVDEDGKRYEVVLSTDKRVQVLNRAMAAVGKRMAQSLGAGVAEEIDRGMKQAEKLGYGGVLRAGNEFRLQSLQEKAQPAGHYALPRGAAPMKMPAMPAMPQFDPSMMNDPAAMERFQKQMEAAQKQMEKMQQGR